MMYASLWTKSEWLTIFIKSVFKTSSTFLLFTRYVIHIWPQLYIYVDHVTNAKLVAGIHSVA